MRKTLITALTTAVLAFGATFPATAQEQMNTDTVEPTPVTDWMQYEHNYRTFDDAAEKESIAFGELEPFTEEADYMSLPGYYRYQTYAQTGNWLTRDEAVAALDQNPDLELEIVNR
ncbi:MAG: hypothetical protein AB7S38_41455 [Vulcanimicrobiota bacterium]